MHVPLYTNCSGHITKMAITPIYDKNPLNIFFYGTKRPMALELRMWHWGYGPYIPECTNDESGLTFAYFMGRANLIPYALYGECLEMFFFYICLSRNHNTCEKMV